MPKTLRLILGDQLNYQHTWFKNPDEQVTYLMMEIKPEATYVRHHIQKLIGFFLAMRAFADYMHTQGHSIRYFKIDDPDNQQSFDKNIQTLITQEGFEKFEYLLPDEYRLDQQLQKLSQSLGLPSEALDSEHFLSQRTDLAHFFAKKKSYLLESFYRQMRKDHNILMDGGQPLTGKWNYDQENRKKYDRSVPIPEALYFRRDVSELYQTIQKLAIPSIGRLDPENFIWPITRKESLQLLDYFVAYCLPYFGTYQDAMEPNEPYLFHSRLSFALNTKILSPLEVVKQAIAHWEKHQDQISIAQIEGFVRQIIGWREYMRGIYWAKMPAYATLNHFNHQNPLPDFFWTGKTKMACLAAAIGQSLDYAYAHHIQRLMVTGNFALLAGVHPDQVDEWYLGIYMDAIEWVEITNTRGMSQFADGGIVGTKPYISSANYIDKMSHYCKGCYYSKSKKYGDKACPFNSLYWNFYDQHKEKLAKNPRISLMINRLEKMKDGERQNLLEQAQTYLEKVNDL